MVYQYQAFGLNIRSSIEIPELVPFQGEPDINIRFGSVPDELEASQKTTPRFQAKPGCFLLKVDSIAKYLVTNGNKIIVNQSPGASEEEIRLFLLGSAIGAVLHQRGMFPVHASSIKVNNECVMFCGASGYGKSTTANAFIKRGYDLHTDDVCVIAKNKDGIPIVFPEYPHLKLWEDSLLETGQNPESYRRVRHVVDKYTVPTGQHFCLSPRPIKKTYILSPNNNKDITITGLKGMDKFKCLRGQTYRKKFVSGLGTEESNFKAAAFVASHVPVARVQRPKNPFLLKELIDLIEKDFGGK